MRASPGPQPGMDDTVSAAASSSELLHYAVAGRELTGVRYCQSAGTYWLWLEFDASCDLLVMPQTTPTRQRSVP